VSREEIAKWARWVFDTVISFGGNASTAAFVAAHFAQGLENPETEEDAK
jgi:1-aminocyclopropane-1-carboxylate deaminase/D-cysteine desulfhydrase-like pyridoxal-dependent ACC family enzyme